MKQITIQPNDAGQRLDKFLIKYLKTMPASLIYKSLRKKRVKVNGKRETNGGYKLSCGDTLELYINDEFFEQADEAQAFRLIRTPQVDVVYEDANVLLVNKPQGMVVHADEHEQVNTLLAHIQSYLFQKGEYDPEGQLTFAPALVNRIDRNTQGIVIAAKNAESLRILSNIVKTRQVHKQYLCIAQGIFEKKEATLTGYLMKDAEQNRVTVFNQPAAGARTIVTHYRVLKEGKTRSLVEVELITGRTHQIRAHLAHIGHPLLGDGKYGTLGEHPALRRQVLCSYRLHFDLTEDCGILNYLNGMKFTIPTDFEQYLD